MTDQLISCALCGYRYNPDEHLTCNKCPLQAGCNLTCCPSCGYETIDPGKSRVARWISQLFSPFTEEASAAGTAQEPTLARIAPGRRARVERFAPHTSPQRKAHLQAYGVAPGHTVHVLQHKPVTVIEIDHLELALENKLAETIFVTEIDQKEGK